MKYLIALLILVVIVEMLIKRSVWRRRALDAEKFLTESREHFRQLAQRYDAAVRALAKSQQEAAQLREQVRRMSVR